MHGGVRVFKACECGLVKVCGKFFYVKGGNDFKLFCGCVNLARDVCVVAICPAVSNVSHVSHGDLVVKGVKTLRCFHKRQKVTDAFAIFQINAKMRIRACDISENVVLGKFIAKIVRGCHVFYREFQMIAVLETARACKQ